MNSERINLRATLALLEKVDAEDIQTWFDAYDWGTRRRHRAQGARRRGQCRSYGLRPVIDFHR
jgi:hypothetical protein